MNLKKAKEFVEEISGELIDVILDDKSEYDAVIAYTEVKFHGRTIAVVDAQIQILPEYWHQNRENDIEIRSVLLHEVGHIKSFGKKANWEKELYAHLWAIRKAKRMGLLKEREFLIKTFQEWENFDWNSKARRYILARRKFLENRMSY